MFKSNVNFSDIFSENTQISSFMEIRPVGAELFCGDGETDRRTEIQGDMTRQIVAFLNFANAPERGKLGNTKAKEKKGERKKERRRRMCKNEDFIEAYVPFVWHFIEASLEILLFYVFICSVHDVTYLSIPLALCNHTGTPCQL